MSLLFYENVLQWYKGLSYIHFKKHILLLCYCCIHAPYPPIYVHTCNIKHIFSRDKKHSSLS